MVRNHKSQLSAFQAFFTISPMNFVMTICTQRFKICNFIIETIAIKVMNYQNIYIIISTAITYDFSMIFNRARIAFSHICNFRIQSSVDKIRTFPRTKHFFSTLKSFSPGYNFPAQLARISLNAS